MNIREAQDKDEIALSQLLEQLGYPSFNTSERILEYQLNSYKLFVGEIDSEVVGFIALHWYHAFHHPKPVGRIVAFVIDDKFRGKGFGSELLKYAEDFLISKGCLKLELTSNLRRKESHQYYLNKGYIQTSMHLVKIL